MTAEVRLRPLREGDLAELERFAVDPAALGEHEWTGFSDPAARRRRWETDGCVSAEQTTLAVELADGTFAGMVQAFRPYEWASSSLIEIGCGLFPEHRGRGVGTTAQRLLVAELLATRPLHRLQATTEAENMAERRALEAIGFQEDGILRGATFMRGVWRDVVLYGLLRGEERT